MEYLGSFEARRADKRRRFLLPPQWLDDTEEFFFVRRRKSFDLYPASAWKKILFSKKNRRDKAAWSKKSSSASLDQSKRMTLPKQCSWTCIDLTGIGDCIIINESAE